MLRGYRDADIAVTKRGADNPAFHQFVDFLESREGAAIFARWGSMSGLPRASSKAPT